MERGERREPARAPALLAEELTGQLRCAACRYELRGLSVKGHCPECGLPIQATLLSIVDPMAEELRPIRRPRLVAAGLVAWSLGALLGALLGWFVWISGVSGLMEELFSTQTRDRLVVFGAVALAASGIGCVVLVRPQRDIPVRRMMAAATSVALYPLVIWLYVDLGSSVTTDAQQSLLAAFTANPEPAPWRAKRLLLWLLVAAVAWLLRGNLRVLAMRSLVLRAQRVDHQTIAAGVAALMVAAVGDLLGLAAEAVGSGFAGSLVLVGEVLVILGAVLMSVGLIGVLLDVMRLLPAVLHRPLARRDVVRVVGVPEGGEAGA